MTSLHTCKSCGATQPRDATAGLCPACLVRSVTQDLFSAEHPDPERAAGESIPGIGSRLGDYVLESLLGGGGMGVVYRARQTRLNRLVALKLLPLGRFTPDAQLRRFQTEAEAIARLRHPNIVTVFEVGEHDGQRFLSMELVDGPDLAAVVRERLVPAREAARLCASVAEAVHHAHQQGIVHRDLKPSNILLGADGRPRVTDFGLAKDVSDQSEVTRTGETLGSPHYIPPEQATGQPSLNRPTGDVYGIGAILYHLLTRHPPFVGETMAAILHQVALTEPVSPRLLNPDVPRDLETICLKCLEKDPGRRYASAAELAAELNRFLRDEPIRARPISALARSWRWCRRRPALASMAAVTAVTLCAGLSISLFLWHRARDRAHQLATSLLHVELDRAEDLFEREDSPEALARLARLLRSHPADPVVAQRIVSALTHRSFLQPASVEAEHSVTGRITPPPGAGRRLYCLESRGRTLVVWDTTDGLAREREVALGAPARFIACSADGAMLAVVRRENAVELRPASDPASVTARCVLPAIPRTVQFDRDGSRLLALLEPKGLALIAPSTGVTLLALPDPHFAELSPDGNHLVSVAGNEAVIRSLREPGSAPRRLRHPARIETARFSPDSSRLVTASADMTAGLWTVATGQRAGSPLVHQEQLLDAVFSPDGQRVLTESLSAQAQLWDAAAAVPLGQPFTQWRELHSALFSPDGHWLLNHFEDRIRLRDAFTGRAVSEPLSMATGATGVRFLPDGRRFLIAGNNGRVRLWSALPGAAEPIALRCALEVVGTAFSADGSKVLTYAKEPAARLWSSRDGRPLGERLVHERRVSCGAFDPAGRRVATGDVAGIIRIWDTNSGAATAVPLRHEGGVTALAFTADGSGLLVATNQGEVCAWDAGEGSRRWEFRHTGAIRTLTSAKDGRTLAVVGGDRVVRLLTTSDGKLLATFALATQPQSVAFSPDGRLLATGETSGTVRFWDLARSAESGPPLQHNRDVASIQFSPDGRQLVTGSSDQTARVWNVEQRRARSRPMRHSSRVTVAAFSPDARHILTASEDHTARVWDAATGHPVTDALRHGNRVVDAAWAPDGRSVVTASWDGSARIWSLPLNPVVRPDSARLATLAENFGRLRLTDEDVTLKLIGARDPGTVLGRPPAPGPNHLPAWEEWLLADRATRGIAPGFGLTPREFMQTRLDETRAERLHEALRLAPMHAEGLARWSRLVLRQNPERNRRRLGEAAFAAELAVQLAPESFEAWWSLAEVRLSAGERDRAREALLRAVDRLPVEISAGDRQAFNLLRNRLGNVAR